MSVNEPEIREAAKDFYVVKGEVRSNAADHYVSWPAGSAEGRLDGVFTIAQLAAILRLAGHGDALLAQPDFDRATCNIVSLAGKEVMAVYGMRGTDLVARGYLPMIEARRFGLELAALRLLPAPTAPGAPAPADP